jgi:hypothetical protein
MAGNLVVRPAIILYGGVVQRHLVRAVLASVITWRLAARPVMPRGALCPRDSTMAMSALPTTQRFVALLTILRLARWFPAIARILATLPTILHRGVVQRHPVRAVLASTMAQRFAVRPVTPRGALYLLQHPITAALATATVQRLAAPLHLAQQLITPSQIARTCLMYLSHLSRSRPHPEGLDPSRPRAWARHTRWAPVGWTPSLTMIL